MKTVGKIPVGALVVMILVASVPHPSLSLAADPVPFVDGDMWNASSRLEKVSYIVGLSNLMDTEYAFQQKSGSPPGADQSFVAVIWDSIDDLTVDECIDRIDDWYERNPDEMDTTVIDVIWVDMVEPNLE